jgi:hypothetical protein
MVFGVFLALTRGGPVSAEEIWVTPTPLVPPGLTSFPWPTSGSGFASFAFAVPDDFQTYTSMTVVLIPKSDLAGSFDAYASVKREGQVASEGILSDLGIASPLLAGRIDEIDVTGLLAGRLNPISAGRDYVSVFFWSPTAPGLTDATVLGLRFTYVPDRIGTDGLQGAAVTTEKLASGAVTTGKLENGAVTNAKLADSSVGTDKVVDNSLTSADIANNSLTGVDIADGSIGTADVDPNQVQQRVSNSCPLGQSIRRIRSDGQVDCEPDTAGLSFYARTSGAVAHCSPGDVCSRSVSCFGSQKAMGGGVRLIDGPALSGVDLIESFPSEDSEWSVTIRNTSLLDGVDYRVFVTCSNAATGDTSLATNRAAARPPANRPGSRPLSRKQ